VDRRARGVYAESLDPRTAAGLFLVSLVALGVSTVRINFIIMKHYRCPSCEKIPIVNGMHNGVLINPSECPSCGVALR
jgi:DNA polymerase III alpha subunit (gram-positive type)